MQFKIKVTVLASVDYELTLDAASESDAENQATAKWREMTPSDFQVDKGYLSDVVVEETEQLTWECLECGAEVSESVSFECDEMCPKCYREAEVEATAPRTAA